MQHAPEIKSDQITLGNRGAMYFRVAAAACLVGVVGTFFAISGDHGMQEFYQSYLLNFSFILTIALGALFFLLISYLMRAGWSVGVRRIAEVITWTLLPLAILAVPIVMGMHELYEWTHTEEVANDPILSGKTPYLNENFFIGRLALYFVLWNLMAFYFRSRSLKQDQTGDPRYTSRMERFAAPAVLVYALSVTLASFDLLMSLYPHWYSTIFGVYFFAGGLLGCLATVPLVVMLLQRVGKLTDIVNSEHFHDLGKLMFAFTVFWAYIAFSQYMLIWYANLPEETIFFQARQDSTFWGSWSSFLIIGHFFVPFLVIMSRYQKRRRPVLAGMCLWMLAMHWVDLYWVIMPSLREGNPLRLVDFTLLLAFVGFFVAVVFWRLGQAQLVPAGDPRMAESLSFENV